METAKYTINGKVYFQRPLVVGQIEQLGEFLEGLSWPTGNLGAAGIVKLLGNKLARAIAIVLREEGRLLRDKDIEALEAEFKEHLEHQTALKVVNDFLEFNPPSSVPDALNMMTSLARWATDGLGIYASSSQAETSPKKMTSSGDTPSRSANPISSPA